VLAAGGGRAAAQRVPVGAAELPGLEAAITPDGDVRTLPTMGVDGFYIARLVA
jgi:16S rRNA (cytosine967-C5)-methyltransferase